MYLTLKDDINYTKLLVGGNSHLYIIIWGHIIHFYADVCILCILCTRFEIFPFVNF